MPRSSSVAVALCVGASLACAGQWRDINAESFCDATVDVERSLAPEAPHRDELLRWIDDGFIAAWERRVGLVDTLEFTLAVRSSASDGRIDAGELERLGQLAQRFAPHLVDAERRAELLAFKAVVDARRRVEVPPEGR